MKASELFTGDNYGGEENVICPVCRDDFSHISEVFTRLGTDENEAGVYRGTIAKAVVFERRSALAIIFRGECGHKWELRIQQHKGVNIASVHVLPSEEVTEGPLRRDHEVK